MTVFLVGRAPQSVDQRVVIKVLILMANPKDEDFG